MDSQRTRNAFHELRELYAILARRALKNKLFLPRNLLRRKIRLPPNVVLPRVTYRSAEEDVSWQMVMNNLRCLWCKSSFYRFVNPEELLRHLLTCHEHFHYSLTSLMGSRPHIIVDVQMFRDCQGIPCFFDENRPKNIIFEATLVDKRKGYRRTSERSQKGSKLVSPADSIQLSRACQRSTPRRARRVC